MRSMLAALLAAAAGAAEACDKPIAFGDEEAVALLESAREIGDADFRAILDFDRLLCAERKVLRDAARQAGRASPSAAVRTRALQSALFEKDVINLTVLPKENMTEEEAAFLLKTPIIAYQITAIDEKRSCLSLYQSECPPKYLISLSGTEADLIYANQRAKLRLAEDGALRGVWSNGDANQPISVPVELRLD